MTNLTASQNLIEIAIQKSMELSKIIQSDKKRSPRVITISRELGSGGRIIAEKLHESLGWPIYDKEILEVLASQCQKGSGYRSAMFEALDEKTQTGIQAFIASCLGQLDKHSYFSLLSKAIILIAQGDAIILGRGAHLFLPKALNVRVKASFATRERNLQ